MKAVFLQILGKTDDNSAVHYVFVIFVPLLVHKIAQTS